MEQLNKTPTTGKFGDVAKVLDTNFGLIVTKLMELSKAKGMNCGFYSSETELKMAYPNPDKGMMAYVGSGTDFIVYRCKTDGTWTATSETFKVTVDLSTYATKDALAQVKGSVDSLLLGAVYGGIAARTTNPGTPETKVFYLPTEVGEYPNFGNLSVVENEIAFLYYDGTNWTKQSVDFSSNFNEINGKLGALANKSKELEDNIGKKFDKESVVQESGDAEDKVMSQKAVSDKLSGLSATINKESELGVTQHFVKDDFTTKVEVKETNFFYPNDVVKLICTNKSSKDSWFSVGTFGSDGSESEIQSKVIKAGETLVIDRTEQYSGNGYWCKSIGNAKGKFEVYRTDPKVTKNTKELAKKIDKTSILQESGEAEDKVMSQKAVSDSINLLSKDVSNLKSSVVNEQKISFLSSEKAAVPSVANQATILQFSPIANFNGKKLTFEITPDGIVNQENVKLYFALNGQNTKKIAELGSVSGTEKKTYSVECNLDFKFNQIWIYPTTNGTSGNIKIDCSYISETSLKSDVDTLKSDVEAIESRTKMYVGTNREFTKFTDGLAAAVTKRNVDLYVDAGTYDIVAELTVAKIDSDSIAGYYGPKIGRGVRIYFSQGAKIIANYTGTLNASLERFSPLNAIETTDIGGSDFEIHGGEFECTNTRYVVHDECNGKGCYKHLYDNCRMILDNRNKTYFKTCQCIGGGLGEFSDIQIIGGYYESKNIDINKSNLDQVISYHNPQPNFGSNFCNSVMIKDAYFKDGTIIVSQLGDSLKYSTFVVNNCSMTKAPYINGENDAGTGRFRMQSWNNDIRNS